MFSLFLFVFMRKGFIKIINGTNYILVHCVLESVLTNFRLCKLNVGHV